MAELEAKAGTPSPTQPATSAAPSPVPALGRLGLGGGGGILQNVKYALPVIGPLNAVRDASDAWDKLAYRAGGAVTDTATKLGASPQTAAKLGVLGNAVTGAVPAVVGGAEAKLASPQFAQAGRRLMQMTLKPNLAARRSGDAERGIETLLEKGFNVTEGGVQKMTAMIDELDAKLTAAIAKSPAQVSTISIVRPVKEALEKFRFGLDHAKDQAAVKGEMLKFFDHPQVQQAFQIPVQTAQKIKQAIYKEVGDAGYGTGLKSSAEREGKKAVARGLREGIERAEPSAAGINKDMGDVINARKLAKERVLQAGNRGVLGIGALIHNPAMIVPWMAERTPLISSLAARGLYSGREAIPQSLGTLGGAVAGAEEGTRPRK